MIDLRGHVSVVTGGNRGIGLGMANALADAGADVAVWGRDPERNEGAREALAATGSRSIAVTCDVSDETQVIAAMERTVTELGRVDSLFANAGIGGYARFTEMSLEEFRRVTAVNLDGAFLSLREAARHMVGRGDGGSLVAVSSVAALDGAPGMEHYGAAKAGVLAMMRGLAVELARYNVRCNSLLPGWIGTDMTAGLVDNEKFVNNTVKRTPVRRWGEPADLGPAAVFLADPSNRFHTGDSIVVDGGYSIY